MVTRTQLLHYNNVFLNFKAVVLNQGQSCPPGDSWLSLLGEKGQRFQHLVGRRQRCSSTSNNTQDSLHSTELSGPKCHQCQRWESPREGITGVPLYPCWPLSTVTYPDCSLLNTQKAKLSHIPIFLGLGFNHFFLGLSLNIGFFNSYFQQVVSCSDSTDPSTQLNVPFYRQNQNTMMHTWF